MLIINAVRDFAEGLARGVSYFFTERSDYNEYFMMPEAAWPKCLPQKRTKAMSTKPK